MMNKDILGTIGNTPMVEIDRMSPNPNVRIFAKLEGNNPTGSLKDRIAKYMIERAEADGSLNHDKIILEPTSGNTGIALAFIDRRKGYHIKVVMPENVSHERAQLLEAYGAEIVFSDGAKGTNGAIVVAEEMAAENPNYFMPYQYGNDSNPRAHYEGTAKEILDSLPQIDVFVAGLGTGGTLMGVARRLKEHNPKIRIVAVAPHPDDVIQGLRSLEEGFIPPILDLSLLDSRIMIEGKLAFWTTKELMQKEAIFAGISSGAVVACAQQLSKKLKTGNILCLLADGGWKYLSTSLWTREYPDLEDEISGKIWW